MATCVLEHCEQEGGSLNIRFSTHPGDSLPPVQYEARVTMCVSCWEKMRRANPADCDVKFSEIPGQFVDLGIFGRLADVKEIRLKA